jgi:hypothetical protein
MRFDCILLLVQCEGQKDGSVDVTRRLADILCGAWVGAGVGVNVCVRTAYGMRAERTDGATGCGLKYRH